MEILDKTAFFEMQHKMRFIPHTQHCGWLEYLGVKRHKEILYVTDNRMNPTIACWGEIYKMPLIGRILRIEGESLNGPVSVKKIKEFYMDMMEYAVGNRFAFVRISSNAFYDVDYEIGIRQAGFIRPMALSLCPLTVIVDPSAERKPKKSWHYQLAQAKHQGYVFEAIETPSENDIRRFVDMYAEMAATKGLTHIPDEASIKTLLKDAHYRLFFLYAANGNLLAAHLDYFHNERGFHIMSANKNEARDMKGVTQFLMEQVFDWMGAQGVKCYDLGRIGPSTHSTNSVCEFKRYSGGQERSYNGEWLYAYKSWTEFMYAVYLSYKKIKRF